MQDTPVSRWVYAGYSCQQDHSVELLEASHQCLVDGFVQNTPVSRRVYTGYSCQQMGLCRILLSADGFMQDTPVSRWVYAGYSCQHDHSVELLEASHQCLVSLVCFLEIRPLSVLCYLTPMRPCCSLHPCFPQAPYPLATPPPPP
jgi:hypothetical protein